MKAVNVRKERTILACFSALDPGLAGSCLARVGVDPAAALAEADPDTVCHALGQLVANRDNVTLSTLLPCLSLRPEMPLPLARLSVRAAHTFQNNSIDTVGQLSMMSCSDPSRLQPGEVLLEFDPALNARPIRPVWSPSGDRQNRDTTGVYS